MLTKKNKDITILIIGKILQVIIALASIRILTEVLSEQEVGNYYLLLTVLAFFNFSFLNPLGQYYGRYLIKWKDGKNLFNATRVLLVLRTSGILLALFVSYGVYQVFEYDRYYTLNEFLLFIFISLTAGIHGVLLSAINVLGSRIKFVTYTILSLFFGLLLSLIIIHFIGKTSMNWLYGVAVSQLFFSIGIYKSVIKGNKFSVQKIKSVLNKNYIKKITIFLTPIVITLFLQWGQNISYRFIIEIKYSLEVLAFIGVGLAISSSIFATVESLASQFYNPIYLKNITYANKEGRENAWNELVDCMMPIYIFVAIFIIALSPYLVNFLVAQKFHEAYIYTMYGAIIEFFRVMTNLVYKVSQSEVKTKTTVVPYAVGFFSTVVFLYMFDFSDKFWAIPLVLIVTNIIVFILLFQNMNKLLNLKIQITNIVKSFVLVSPLFLALLFNSDKVILQNFLVLSISSCYLIFLTYIVTRKRILGGE